MADTAVLDKNSWRIENVSDKKGVVVEIQAIKQAVELFKVKNSTVQVKGKFTTLTITNAEKTGVVVDSVVAAIELTNCKSVQIQVMGSAPSISVDNTDGATLFLSKEAMGAEIITCKSINLNIVHPKEGSEDMAEEPVPSQFKTTFANGKWTTEPVSHVGV